MVDQPGPKVFPSGQFDGCEPTRGITMRDWFAAQVIGHIIATDGMQFAGRNTDLHVSLSYQYADAMMKEHERIISAIPSGDIYD